MRIAELVKTYRLLNDPNAPDWNVKFVGALAIVALVGAGTVAVLMAGDTAAPQNRVLAASEAGDAPGTKVDYVGYDPATFDIARGFQAGEVAGLVETWHRQHPDAEVLSKTPREEAGLIIGYEIVWR